MPFARVALLLATVALGGGLAQAQGTTPTDDPDSEVARTHFSRGTELYGSRNYTAAIAEFTAANEAKSHPDYDYNIGRCYDRLGNWARAIEYYKRYLAARPNATDAAEVRLRTDELAERIRRASPAPPPPWRLRVAAITLGTTAIATVAVGGAMYGWTASDLPSRRAYCRSLPRQCVPSEWSDLSARANASYALFGVTGALVIADVILWALDLKQRRGLERPRISVAPTGRGGVIGVVF